MQTDEATVPQGGHLAENIAYFGRLLRKLGIRVGSGDILGAVEAIEAIGPGSKTQFRSALRSSFVSRRDDIAIFDEAFALFWNALEARKNIQTLMNPLSPRDQKKAKPKAARTRVSNAMLEPRPRRPQPPDEEKEQSVALTTSSNEALREMDFAQMSLEESRAALAALRRFTLPVELMKTRRFGPAHRPGRLDHRAMLRQSMRSGGTLLAPRYQNRTERQPPLVILMDVSGSMADYTRILMHFAHLMTARRPHVSTFLFGTRLTNVTRPMRLADPDDALDRCSHLVQDWSGGTRISETLKEFNRVWGRRVLGQGAVVLLVTDGLEHGDPTLLGKEMDRLHRSCRRLIWLNPLLRYDAFEPRARGIRTMLAHTDEFRPVHNLNSLETLLTVLGQGRLAS